MAEHRGRTPLALIPHPPRAGASSSGGWGVGGLPCASAQAPEAWSWHACAGGSRSGVSGNSAEVGADRGLPGPAVAGDVEG